MAKTFPDGTRVVNVLTNFQTHWTLIKKPGMSFWDMSAKSGVTFCKSGVFHKSVRKYISPHIRDVIQPYTTVFEYVYPHDTYANFFKGPEFHYINVQRFGFIPSKRRLRFTKTGRTCVVHLPPQTSHSMSKKYRVCFDELFVNT